jgi:hypothetical protein
MRYRIPNGYARRHGCTAKDVDPAQLKLGTDVEMEHTRDRGIAREIALDHLCENKGRPYYIRRTGVRHEQLLLKQNGFGDAACSDSPRWVRGSVGFLIGTLLGGMIGGGVALAVVTTQTSVTAPVEAVKRFRNMAVVASGITVVGAIAGLAVGAHKPEC